jgi:chorismate dehydratase
MSNRHLWAMEPIGPFSMVAVSYANTYPFLYGLETMGLIGTSINLTLAIPSKCASMLASGEADLGLVPVGALYQLSDAQVISDFCIGADGPVQTVCLFSEVALEQITHVYLDHHSRTSVLLMRVLAQRHFGINPIWIPAGEGYIQHIKGTTAGVVIGDRAFGLLSKYPVVIDLAEEWKRLTGLPFVFACWVSRVTLPSDFLSAFNSALAFGVKHREEAVRQRGGDDAPRLLRYVNQHISYELDDRKREAMRLFLTWSSEL